MGLQDVVSKIKSTANGVQIIAEDVTYDAGCVEIYKVTVGAGSNCSVNLSNYPIGSSGVALFAVFADSYLESGSPVLSYKMHAVGQPARTLENAHLLNGVGAVNQLGYMDVILLYNAGEVAHTFTIIVGRPALTP